MKRLSVAAWCLLVCSASTARVSARDTAGPAKPSEAEPPKAHRAPQHPAAAPARTPPALRRPASHQAGPPSAPAAVPAPAASAADADADAPPAVAARGTEPEPQPPPPADRTEEAKRWYERGAEAFAARQNAEAIRDFRKAAALAPDPKLTYNIALVYAEMGDTGRALVEYRAYLRQETDPVLSEEVTARIRELEDKLRAAGVQLLSVTTRPPGALVKLDGKPVGVTPWSAELAPGAHDLALTLDGHAPHQGTVWLSTERAAELDVELAARPPRPPPGALQQIAPLTWSFLGVGAGAFLGGVAFELSRAKSSDRAGHTSSTTAAAEARGAADAKQMASLLLLGSGTAFLIGGGVLLALDLTGADDKSSGTPDSSSEARLELPCTPGFCGVVTHGSF